MLEENSVQNDFITVINQVADLRLRVADFIILPEGCFGQFALLKSLEQVIASVRVLDSKINDFELTRAISCIISETGHLISNKGAKEYRRVSIDWVYVYRNLFYVNTALVEYNEASTNPSIPRWKLQGQKGAE